MQIGGINNSGLNSHSGSHHVTSCLHHDEHKRETGGMRTSSFTLSQTLQQKEDSGNELSLIDFIKNTIAGGKRLLGRIWGSDAVADNPVKSQSIESGNRAGETGTNPVMSYDDDVSNDAKVAGAAMTVQPPQMHTNANPYFTTHSESGAAKESLLQHVRIKLSDMSGRMAKKFGGRLGERLAGRFSGKNQLNAKQRRPKEDLRKRSRYRGEDEEIDCVLTDDSYLMDSYNRKGEYTSLTTKS